MVQTCEALRAAWQLGIVHRDVKPGNILIAKDGTAKLADLGLAIIVNHRFGEAGPNTTGRMEGTVAYMAPEQAESSGAVDHRADLYALGATLYHTITGVLPFRGQTRARVLLKHKLETPEPPHRLVPELPARVSAVILRLMAKSPDDRYQSYDELIDDLNQIHETLDDDPTTCRQDPTVPGDGSTDSGNRSLWKSFLSSLGVRGGAHS
jgi:serine/threonine protein kinase